MHSTLLLLLAAGIDTAPAPVVARPTLVPAAVAAAAPRLALLYAAAVAGLLGEPAEQEFLLLPSSARPQLVQRPRRASGVPRTATLATTREVAAILSARGYRGMKGTRSTLGRSPFLQLVLGEVRFEPPDDPAFARLVIGVVGSDGSSETMEVLLKREGEGWRVVKVEVEG